MNTLQFDFATDDSTTGFRLSEFEFYNWGTYNKKITKLRLDGSNALLTGDIGSGKSTIVDALTTLLVPHSKIVYNKAAGANSKERTLYSYIVGEYKSTQDENFGTAKAVALRDENSFSVILGKFKNIGFDEVVTLAQFFYINNKQVHKFFVVSRLELDIKRDFFDFENIKALKKRLKAINHTEVFDTFKGYSKSFMRVMGLKNEQALNLFYQTVSMKSIGNLTSFIRTHMLEDTNVDEKIDDLCNNFAELNHTHKLVLRAKRQIELLSPLQRDDKKYKESFAKRGALQSQKEALDDYFAIYERELVQNKLQELELDLKKSESKQKILQEDKSNLESEILDIRLELQKNGADRLAKIDSEIKRLSQLLQMSKAQNERYNALIKELGMSAVSNEHRFLKTQEEVKSQFESIDEKRVSLQNSLAMDLSLKDRYKKEIDELSVEIAYLKSNPSNIPQRVSKIRDLIAKEIGVSQDDLPFVGELINPNDKRWQGAIERVLHSTSLSLLVDSKYYEKVSDFVDKTHLKGKLVYLKVDTNKKYSGFEVTAPNSLVSKVDIKVDSPFFGVVKEIIYSKFDIACVESLEEFRRFKRALSINGQFKSNYTRHEKDDRFDINDKSRWTLGWDNKIKLKEYEQKLEQTKQKYNLLLDKIATNKKEQKELESIRDIMRDTLKYTDFEEINWYRYSKDIDSLQIQKEEIQKSNDIIKTLQNRLEQTKIALKELEAQYDKVVQKIGHIKSLQERYTQRLEQIADIKIEESLKLSLDALKKQLIDEKMNLNNIGTQKKAIESTLNSEISKLNKILDKLSSSIISKQKDYMAEFPVESKEFLAGVDSTGEFLNRLKELKRDNLPKWEKRFKELLKEKTIQNVVILQSELEHFESQIKKKIETINLSLKDIEYSSGTYIELVASTSKNVEIKEFKQSLKQITSGAIYEDNSYDEAKFLQIKELIDRFNGREGFVDVDKKWRKLVSDVRNWFDFSAIEKYISDGEIKEFYAHSGGKSGGQKEKLAYTVLASSLAYQFGLEHDKIQSRSFRFVMIDEAFGRGSDESTRYALKLFEKLRLQLLVITPKQKINVIEPFVKSVHFVTNKDGMDSHLISMSIEEYQERK